MPPKDVKSGFNLRIDIRDAKGGGGELTKYRVVAGLVCIIGRSEH